MFCKLLTSLVSQDFWLELFWPNMASSSSYTAIAERPVDVITIYFQRGWVYIGFSRIPSLVLGCFISRTPFSIHSSSSTYFLYCLNNAAVLCLFLFWCCCSLKNFIIFHLTSSPWVRFDLSVNHFSLPSFLCSQLLIICLSLSFWFTNLKADSSLPIFSHWLCRFFIVTILCRRFLVTVYSSFSFLAISPLPFLPYCFPVATFWRQFFISAFSSPCLQKCFSVTIFVDIFHRCFLPPFLSSFNRSTFFVFTLYPFFILTISSPPFLRNHFIANFHHHFAVGGTSTPFLFYHFSIVVFWAIPFCCVFAAFILLPFSPCLLLNTFPDCSFFIAICSIRPLPCWVYRWFFVTLSLSLHFHVEVM